MARKAANVNKLAVEYRPIKSLIPYANNARLHNDAQVAQIAASIKEFGFTNPVLIDGDGGIIAGHGRILAARLLGMTDVPCIALTGLSDAQRRAYVLADNKLALNAGWDDEMLAVELSDLADMDFDLSLIGFGDDELARLVSDAEPGEWPELPDGAKPPFQQMTFTVHDDQAEIILSAMKAAAAKGPFSDLNENSNGNALSRVCELFISNG